MPSIHEVCQHLDSLAPVRLAEEWDNVGLLVGDRESAANRIMTCLTVTPETVAEAIDNQADLIVSHHPLPFRPIKRITTDKVPTRMLWQLIRAGVAVYSPHTGFDSAANGINQSLGQQLGLTDLRPLNPLENDPQGLGSGRIGNLPAQISVAEFGQHLKAIFELPMLQLVGRDDQSITRIAIACGSGGSFLSSAARAGADALVTGESNFHTALEAKACGVALFLLGHYSSERFALEQLADSLGQQFSQAKVWASQLESDPLSWL